jgi:anti-sigma-K factor RskA
MNANCQPFRDLLPAYALEALDPDEARILETHLKTCPDCRASLEEYRAVSEGLLFALPPKAPPPRVRARLIARLAAAKAPAPSVRRAWPIWQLAGGLALAVLLVLNVSTLSQLQTLQRQQGTLTKQLQTSQTALALVAYPEGRTLAVTGQQAAGTLVLNSELKSGVLFAWGLQMLDEAHAYQVWLIQPDGRRVSGGLFRPEPGQPFVSVIIPSSRPFSDFTGLGVTVEPSEGSPEPTGPKVLGTSF